MINRILTVTLIVFMVSCGGLGKLTSHSGDKVVYPNEVSDQMRADFGAADALYRQRQFDAAFQSYQKYIDAYGYNALADESLYKQGKIYFLKHDFMHAAATFESMSGKTPDPHYRAKGWDMAGYARYKNVDYAGALAAFRRVAPGYLEPLLRMQFHSLVILTAQALNQDDDFADRAKLGLYDTYESQGRNVAAGSAVNMVSYDQLKPMLDAWLSKPMATNAFPAWMKKYPDVASKALVDFKIAKTYYEEHSSKARRLLSVFVNNYPKSPYFSQADSWLAALGGAEKVASVKGSNFTVGVLLPLGGAQSAYADEVLRGVRCAAGEGGVCGGNGNIVVVVRDSGFTPDMVRSGMDQLVAEDVAGVISILPGALASEAASYASEKNVPLLIISQQEGLMNQRADVFQLGLTPERMVRELADAAIARGMRSFAVFYPSIPYGQKMSELFSQAVTAQGGRVLSKVAYPKGVISQPVAEALHLKQDIDQTKSGASGEGAGVDAIFVPDTYSGANAAASTLASNGLSGMALIGTNTWNDPGLSSAIGSAFPGSFFIDLYDPSSGGDVADFKRRYMESFGGDPQNLSALGYDAMMMVRAAVASEGAGHVGKALDGRVSFSGVTGVSGFKAGEEPILRPRVINVQQFTAGGF